jgi:uncharacterized protein YuzE
MRITYDDEAYASYIYFTSIGSGEAATTVACQRVSIELDEKLQITAVKLFESDELRFQGKLNYILQHPHTTYDPATQSITIYFARIPPTKIVPWEANVDLDGSGQILGIELLFAHDDHTDSDGQETLCAKGKLDHLAKYMI